MPDTHGFETVAELAVSALRQIMRAAWKSGGDNGDPGVVPEFFDVPAGTMIGPYAIADGQVQLPQSELDVALAPDINGVALTFGLALQIEVQNPPVPSASMLEMHAVATARAPVGTLPPTNNVGILLDSSSFPRANVSVVLDSGDPFGPNLPTLLAEFVHANYQQDGSSFPHTVSRQDQPIQVFGINAYTVNVWVDLYDDPTEPTRRIDTSLTTPSQVRISVPVHLKIFNVRRNSTLAPTLEDPFGVMTRLVITAPFDNVPGAYAAHLEQATVTVDPLTASTIGNEGTNYNTNRSRVPVLDTMISTQLREQGQTLAGAMGLVSVPSPTIAQIESAIGDAFYQQLAPKQSISIWTPEVGGASPIQVNDVLPKALTDALAIAINSGAGADPAALTNFVPAGRDFAIGVTGSKILQIIDETMHRPQSEGGFGPNFPPKRFSNVNGHDADLTSLTISLQPGAIHMAGDVTVIDAVAGSIDVDASFTEDVGLHWVDNPDGTQKMAADAGEPDVDLSLLAWIVSFLIGFITLGLVGGIIAVVVLIIVEGIAERIGGTLVRDQVTNQVSGIGAWPTELVRIGQVQGRFADPVDIDPGGIAVSGTFVVTSTAALTAVVPANAQGPYDLLGSATVLLAAGALHPDAAYQWRTGDGEFVITPAVSHQYGKSGLYIAKLTETINQPGGARSREFAAVHVRDDVPTLAAGSDRTVNEGEVVGFTAPFADPQWLDHHEATWDWGDATSREAGVVAETNTKPAAVGTVTGSHAWCDNGTYVVTLTLRDDTGGVVVDTVNVTVENVAPTVKAPAALFAYPCTVLTLEAQFEDPGWCDTHTATWDFGDCTPVQTAVVVEEHEPPAAKGTATSSHVYDRCGTYQATCTVTDDDGGIGVTTMVVRVTDVANGNFEAGFRRRASGATANDWEPAIASDRDAVTSPLVAEELLVHGGQRAQRIRGRTPMDAGIRQIVGANPGWVYQVTAWYSLAEESSGFAKLGVDPNGGIDPTSPDIVWTQGAERLAWGQLAVRAQAAASGLTIYLASEGDAAGDADAIFDDVGLLAIQPICPPSRPHPESPTAPSDLCLVMDELDEKELDSIFQDQGFTIHSRDGGPLQLATWGEPNGHQKLQLPAGGLEVELPFVSEQVLLTVFETGYQVFAVGKDAAGAVVASAQGTPATLVETLELRGPGIVDVEVDKAIESLLISICARPDRRVERDHVSAVIDEISIAADNMRLPLPLKRGRAD
jgi:PKD domain